jgi:hypothetical protein
MATSSLENIVEYILTMCILSFHYSHIMSMASFLQILPNFMHSLFHCVWWNMIVSHSFNSDNKAVSFIHFSDHELQFKTPRFMKEPSMKTSCSRKVKEIVCTRVLFILSKIQKNSLSLNITECDWFIWNKFIIAFLVNSCICILYSDIVFRRQGFLE